MEILYKRIDCEEDFVLLENDDVIDINACILKIISNDNIKEVQIGDETIQNTELNNEFIYYKYKTSQEDSISIKVKAINENNKQAINKRIIKLCNNSLVYDRIALNKVKDLGERAFENIISELSNSLESYDSSILKNLEDNLKNIEEISKSLKTIIKLAKDINKRPKVDLVEKEILKDSNEVRKINSQSARYFTMHPEHWYREGENQPKPIKILTETFKENRDIYENRLIKYIIYISSEISKKITFSLEASINTLNGSLSKDSALLKTEEFNENIRRDIIEEIREKEKNLRSHRKYISQFKLFNNELKELKHSFKDITLDKKIKIKVTQKILYDKRYYKILKLYKEHLSKVSFSTKEIIETTYPVFYSYMFLMAESICKALYSLGFYEIKSNFNKDINEFFYKNESLIIKGYHLCDEDNNKFRFTLQLNNLISNAKEQIILKLYYGERCESISFTINSIFTNKHLDMDFIESIYERNYSDKFNTTLILNTIDLYKIKFNSEEEEIKGIFKLSTLGNNFLTHSDYEKYGGFKEGMIPFNISELTQVYYKLINLFRLKFIKIGCYEYCTYCGNGPLEFVEDGLLVCSKCGKKIAINKCSNCNEEIIKFISKESGEIKQQEDSINIYSGESIEDEREISSNIDIIEYHKNYEMKSATLGACYEKFYSNSGGFCSKCGMCAKSNKDCIRCKIIN
ncbi:DUF2357 domain-containing protein [Clostridium chromiireducens]|uniref:DUF2357 domain-containing protein n=1 Tax=Clostridium chromiireducens TaxID=225345 RepID=A0A964RRQ6_9CLOT|nr:DUF2357 domain-containing protein [Clostridium chromiireducens]MVX66485.1 DUF2357 domain-containing protein [Clostridium chromiireducens]